MYGVGLFIWGRVPEPMCIIHLHNMLVQTGFLDPGGTWTEVGALFSNSFFPWEVSTRVHTSDYAALLKTTFHGISHAHTGG